MVAAFAVAMGIFGTIFFYIGVSMGWLYVRRICPLHQVILTIFQLFMGVLLGSAVVPIALCITWSKANKWGCIGGAIAGLVAGIIAWMVTTAKLNSHIDVTTTGGDYEMLAGNLAAIGVGGIVSVVVSLLVSPPPLCNTSFPQFSLCFFVFAQQPENFDFDITRAINTHTHVDHPHRGKEDAKDLDNKKTSTEKVDVEAAADEKADAQSSAESSVQLGITRAEELDPVALNKAFKFAAWSSVALVRSFVRAPCPALTVNYNNNSCHFQTVVMVILIPLPLFGASTIYGVAGFTTWVVVAMIWAFVASFIVVLFPLWESRVALTQVFKGLIKDIMQPGSGKYVAKHHNAA
jgi:hypothetical protein